MNKTGITITHVAHRLAKGTVYEVRVNGTRRGERYEDEAKAIAEVERLRKSVRPCIRCRDEILSEGAHHRMCNNCRNYAATLHDNTPHSVSRPRRNLTS